MLDGSHGTVYYNKHRQRSLAVLARWVRRQPTVIISQRPIFVNDLPAVAIFKSRGPWLRRESRYEGEKRSCPADHYTRQASVLPCH